LSALYRICLLTGNNGTDASHLYQDPDLLGHYYAAPYAVYEPDLCFVLTHNSMPCGYILGARDTLTFYARCEQDWFPRLRERYPMPEADDTSPDARIIRLIHNTFRMDDDLREYPAHLHIDILPVAQGQQLGRKLMHTFLHRLRELGIPAIHLGVGKSNPRAIRFYERVEFHRIKEYDGAIVFGMHLGHVLD
jgi:ribosomal protein S18 acetylase RimI-like enzyme